MSTSAPRSRGSRGQRRDAAGPSIRWLGLASVWLVFVLMPNGATTWLGFAFIGFAVLRPIWIAAAVAYFVATVSFASDAWEAWGVALNGALWVVGIGHGLAANRRWLSILWGRRERGERLFGRGGRPRAATRDRAGRPARTLDPARDPALDPARGRARDDVPAEARALLEGEGAERSDYLAEDTAVAAARTRPQRSSTRRSSTQRSSTRGREKPLPEAPVDVNSATQKDLQALPGMTRQRAKTIVRERDRLGGFRSVEQFATVAALQPHELVRLTPVLTCSPRPRAPRTFGRRVEL